MPNLPPTAPFQDLALRNITQSSTNTTTTGAVQVICAWPVSAQYGPGVRWIYYLILASALFRKLAWLRNFCFAAALLLPAVAALHAIVLASVHINSAVDLDIYGAFQFCALGILVNIRFTRTYFSSQARHILLAWAGLVFAGILCLIVEFLRSNQVFCVQDDNSNPISTDIRKFPYGAVTCGLKCNTSYAVSPLRRGSAKNVYVIPAPTGLTFGTATLLSGACGILSCFILISFWKKFVHFSWRTRFGEHDKPTLSVKGTVAAPISEMDQMQNIEAIISRLLEVVEAPISSAATLAILILGEINFFSAQVRFQTEQMASFGQWGPLVGAALAVLGSLTFLVPWDSENDDLTEPSVYRPLKESQFRVLALHPGFDNGPITGDLLEFGIEEPPKYSALSYVWGQEPRIHQIEINNKLVMIQPNLFQALQRLRARNKIRDSPYFWIDSLCINQADLDEKNTQVGRMAEIYQNAISVTIWLGEEDSVSNSAITFVRQIVAKNFIWHSTWWEAYELTALDQFLGRPWFRRRWVLQKAAFSARSVVICGGEEIPLDSLAYTVSLVRTNLSTAASTMDSWRRKLPPNDIYPAFYDSPATRLFALIENVFQRSDKGVIVERRLHLETLVDLSTFCETSNQRDTIYALLSLAKEQEILSLSQPAYSLVLDYKMELMDVFAGFVLHCCYHSGSLDVICRPWAPGSVSKVSLNCQTTPADRDFLSSLPSWIASKDQLPFGNPSLGLTQRLHAKSLVGRPPNPLESTGRPGGSKSAKSHAGSEPHALLGDNLHHIITDRPEDTINYAEGSALESTIELKEVPFARNRVYNAHYNQKPDVFLGRNSTTQACTGSLFAKVIIIGVINRRSVRMANAVIPAECFEVLSRDDIPPEQPDLWRILCADRDDEGSKAPPSFRSAFFEGIPRAQIAVRPESSTIIVDVEELLQIDGLSENVKRYFAVVRDVVWNRCTFEAKRRHGIGLPLIGLAPQYAKAGDNICILYGCSAPVVLRKRSGDDGKDSYWELIGDAYVHDFMDGEGIRALSLDMLKAAEVLFEIR